MSIFEWNIRAEKYDNLDWTNRDKYMETFFKGKIRFNGERYNLHGKRELEDEFHI